MRPAFPTFVIIGAQKSATRWMRVNLGKHPDVFTADGELEFFNHRFEEGALEYAKCFAGHSGESQVGEATPGYMMWNERPNIIAARIDGLLPGVKLIAVLRNPIDRAFSAFLHHRARGRISDAQSLRGIVESTPPAEEPLSLISGGWYAASLEPFIRRFGDRLAIFLNETIGTAPREVYATALKHIGVADSVVPDDLGRVLYSNRSDGSQRSDLDLEVRSFLRPYFEDDVRRLSEIADVDLSVWSDFVR